jgi:hypothetical protein
MKIITNAVLITALAVPSAVKAQQPGPRYVFLTVAQPGTVIAGRTFTGETIIGSAAINDNGEAVFVASGPGLPAVFTLHRIVARQGDIIDGKFITLLAPDARIAINNAGQVAWEAWYADDKNTAASGEASGRGIFVDSRLVFTTPWNAEFQPFTLGDDGRLVISRERPAEAKTSPQAGPGILNRIRVRSPKDSPVGIVPAPPNRPQRAAREKAAPALAPFAVNHRGQVLIPVNFGTGGFLLLLGTPGAR